MANYHVTKNPSGGWKVLKENAEKPSSIQNTQKEAEHKAKEFSAKNGGGEVSIHGLDGKIHNKDTVKPGNDPRNIKG